MATAWPSSYLALDTYTILMLNAFTESYLCGARLSNVMEFCQHIVCRASTLDSGTILRYLREVEDIAGCMISQTASSSS